MAIKVYTFIKDSYNFKGVLPSGLDSLTGVMNMVVKIRKPDQTLMMKNLVDTDIVSGTKNIKVLFGNGDLDQEGIYDYEVMNSTSSVQQKGNLLQFTVNDDITTLAS